MGIFIVSLLALSYIIYLLFENISLRKQLKESEEKRAELIQVSPSEELPSGWKLMYNDSNKKYRWKRPSGVSGFSFDTKEECIKQSWEQYHYSIQNNDINWVEINPK